MRSPQLIGALLLTLAGISLSNPDAPTSTSIVPTKTVIVRREAAPQTPTGGVGEAIEGETEAEEEPETTTKKETTDEKKTDEKTADEKTTGKASATNTKDDDSASTTGKADGKKTTKTTKIPATAQAGTVNLKTPGIYDPFSYYKIGETLTFGWNYTNVLIKPTAINVEAYNDLARNYFPITMNASADTTAAIWDTGAYQKDALVKLSEATYTLVISEAGRDRNYVASAGYLSTYRNHRFGLYQPREAIPYNEFVCVTCPENGGLSTLDKQLIRMYLGMAGIATLSFSIFVTRAL